jgi:RNA polymerase sigma-70 factor (ECF subfamily)
VTTLTHRPAASSSDAGGEPKPQWGDNTEVSLLISAHLGGNPQAFQALVARYQTRLLNFVYRMIGDRERAEDLVQEAFIRVYRHLHRFDPNKKFSTWIYTIASNLAKNELRNRNRSPLVLFESIRQLWQEEERPVQLEDESSRPDEVFDHHRLQELVDETVTRLVAHHREVFVLRELEGRSYEEIAEIVGCNIGTVKSRLNRARHSFAELIKPHLD